MAVLIGEAPPQSNERRPWSTETSGLMASSIENDLESGLNALAARLAPGGTMANLRRLTAGATQEVWRFELVEGGRQTPIILRRAPGGTRVSDTAIGLETEAALLEAAGAVGVPVPEVRYVLAP